jgi:hypothetical protein
MSLDMVKQNVQVALKIFQGNKNKFQSEAENTINREINELRTKIDNIKEEVTHDIENLRKKE